MEPVTTDQKEAGDMTKKCEYCEKSFKVVGGYFSPQFERCHCGGEEVAIKIESGDVCSWTNKLSVPM